MDPRTWIRIHTKMSRIPNTSMLDCGYNRLTNLLLSCGRGGRGLGRFVALVSRLVNGSRGLVLNHPHSAAQLKISNQTELYRYCATGHPSVNISFVSGSRRPNDYGSGRIRVPILPGHILWPVKKICRQIGTRYVVK